MNVQTKSKISSNELNKQIEQHIQELANATDNARTSEEMIRYLDFSAKFHQYSAGNIWLILMANPDASYVAGYQSWKAMGRWVKRGEQGIPILAPVLAKEEMKESIEEKRLVGFRLVYVYDVSQTDGELLPPVPDWKSPEKHEELNQSLIQFTNTIGVSVEFKELGGDIQGISRGGSIFIDPSAGTKTLIHEIAHELLRHMEDISLSRPEMELEAEATGYIVCRYFGLEDLNSPNYISLFSITANDFLNHMDRIRDVANQIISAIDNN